MSAIAFLYQRINESLNKAIERDRDQFNKSKPNKTEKEINRNLFLNQNQRGIWNQIMVQRKN